MKKIVQILTFLVCTAFMLFLGQNPISANAYTLTQNPYTDPGAGKFIIVVDTRIESKTANNQFEIPTIGLGYNYTVEWGDGNTDSGVTGDIMHTYNTPGIYEIRISGDFPRIKFDKFAGGSCDSDCMKLIDIKQWGDIRWDSFYYAFSGCRNLTGTFKDTPDLTNVTNFMYAFAVNFKFNGDVSNWDTSNITNMFGTFYYAEKFNQDISNWDVSNVKTMRSMFSYAKSFNQPIGNWDTSKVETMQGMFYGANNFDQDISNWNVSSVKNMQSMFLWAYKFNQDISNWDVSNVEDMESMFQQATLFDQPIGKWNVSKVKSMAYMFYNTSNFNQDLSGWGIKSIIHTGDTWLDVKSMTNFLANSKLLTENYEKLLISFYNQVKNGLAKEGLTFNGGNSTYCSSEAEQARNALINTYGWTITDGGKKCPDTTPPTITINGPNPVEINRGQTYNDQGATCTDNIDPNCTVTSTGTVDTSTIGEYTITYTATDSEGNTATATRTIKVVGDGVDPIITLNGENPLELNVDDTFNDPGATATDNIDGDISNQIVTSGFDEDTSSGGMHTIIYSVTDSAGNTASISRVIKIFVTFTDLATDWIKGNYKFFNDDALCGTGLCTDEDLWGFDVTDILIFDSDENAYSDPTKKYRGLLIGNIYSKLYGTFIPNSTYDNKDSLVLIHKDDNGGKCGVNQHTYSVDGSIYNELFGTLDVINELSFFCPASLESFIVFHNELLPKKLVLKSGSVDDEQLLEEDLGSISFEGSKVGNIFEKQQVLIIGPTSLKGNLNNLLNESGSTDINELQTSAGAAPVILSKLNEKIAKLTRNITGSTAITLNKFEDPTFESNGENFFYYDFKGKVGDDNDHGNKGKLVTIQTSPTSFDKYNPTSYQIGINGKNTVIAEGANVYINADLYNTDDSTSLLTIIAKRDENNNGGNIYIDPDVTNIDAVLIADGSVLSYGSEIINGPKKVLNRNLDNSNGLLARQLYIYGSVFSANVVGDTKIPFGADENIFAKETKYDDKKENIYDLANLRGFQTRFADPTKTAINCGSGDTTDWYWTAGYTNTDTDEKLGDILKYAWAGKRECFNNDVNSIPESDPAYNYSQAQGTNTTNVKLRSIGKANSVIIEYNPAIKTIAPFVLTE